MSAPGPSGSPVIAHPQRFHGFDALRGGAMLLGIVLHAAITYMVQPMDGLLWPLRDQPKHAGFDLLFWWIHGWRIPLFFVMAGFFAAMLVRRRGPGGFMKHRVQRILIPVVVASVTLLFAMYFIWSWGWRIEGHVRWEEVWQFDFDTPYYEDHFFTPAHLWFLNYLFIFSCLYWVILKLRKNTPDSDEPTLGPVRARLFTTSLRPIVFAVPTFALLVVSPDFYLGYHHVVPITVGQCLQEIAQLVYQCWFFIVGVYLFRMHRVMEPFQRHGWIYLLFAQGFFVFLVLFWKRGDGAPPLEPGSLNAVIFAAAVSLFCWYMVWGLTGLGLTVLAAPRASVRWLSDSAYWVYLIHLPLVGLLMIWMRDWSIGPWPRFVLIVAITSAATLASYQWCVRYTPIGWLLNGVRKKPGHE